MDARAFLALRAPAPPSALGRWLAAGAPAGNAAQGLVRQGLEELARARRVPGKVRSSAWHLLAADALLTYACEAAMDATDPPRAFEEILQKAAAEGA